MIRWIRYRHKISAAVLKHPQELTVQQITERFGVSIHVVYYWIERGMRVIWYACDVCLLWSAAANQLTILKKKLKGISLKGKAK